MIKANNYNSLWLKPVVMFDIYVDIMTFSDEVGRKTLQYLLFFGFAILYMLRVNLSVAIIAMTKHSKKIPVINSSITSQNTCPYNAEKVGYIYNRITIYL